MSSEAAASAAAAPAASSASPAAVDAEMADVDAGEEQEQRLILEEYKIWKKNTPFLYDVVVSHALEWPSLTIQFLPDRATPEGKDYSLQRLLLGTHTSSEDENSKDLPQNYLMIAEVRLPHGGASASSKPSNAANGKGGKKSTVADDEEEEEEEDGAYGAHSGKIEVIQRIPHKGEVNRARYAPHNPNLIATKSPSNLVYVFDKTRHGSNCPPTDNTFRPDLILSGHESEGYGLSWNPHQSSAGLLLSGSDDALICLWDVESGSREAKKKVAGTNQALPSVAPLTTFMAHKDVVEDVAWSNFAPVIFASAGDDNRLLLWDTRSTPAKPTSVLNEPGLSQKNSGHHVGNINCVSFNHFSEYLLASGSSDKKVNLWDLRRLHAPIHSCVSHTDEVFNVQFSPFSADILVSSGADRRAMVWDLSRIGDVAIGGENGLSEEDAADGPPELLFVHGGHTDKIADIAWNTNVGEEWMLASVADDNILQIWQPSDTIYTDDDEQTSGPAASGHDVEEIE